MPFCHDAGRRQRWAMTLFDTLALLGCIILGCLAILPALAANKEDARNTSCLNNQRQLAVGWANYASEYNFVAANYNDGATIARPSGHPLDGSLQCGSFATWLPNWDKPTESLPVGTGNFVPYVDSPRVYYCPSMVKSNDWYEKTWLGNSPEGGFGKPGKWTYTTYYYRGGVYYREKWPFKSIDVTSTMMEHKRPDAEFIQGKPFITCHWSAGLDNHPLRTDMPHDGVSVNLGYPDGHAETWDLPQGVLPLWARYESADAVNFAATGFDTNHLLKQLPWWWVLADTKDQ
jgi:hypothetical protein